VDVVLPPLEFPECCHGSTTLFVPGEESKRVITFSNDRRFEDHERSLAELESFFFFTLYTWIAVFVAPWEHSFLNSFVLFSPPS